MKKPSARARFLAFALAGISVFLGCATTCLALNNNEEPTSERATVSDQSDFNRAIYYRNKLEVAYDMGVLWFNTPLILDPILGDHFQRVNGTVDYTLIPMNLSLRWHLYDICGPSILRGNTDFTFTGSYSAIVQGPESYYAALILGLRYNFIQPNWKLVPYFDVTGGAGLTDAQQPYQKRHHLPQSGQGQDLTFIFTIGAGLRYNFNPSWSVSLGAQFLHISNGGLSTPQYYNHGINVVGPVVGLNVALPTITSALRSMTEGVKVPLDEIARGF